MKRKLKTSQLEARLKSEIKDFRQTQRDSSANSSSSNFQAQKERVWANIQKELEQESAKGNAKERARERVENAGTIHFGTLQRGSDSSLYRSVSSQFKRVIPILGSVAAVVVMAGVFVHVESNGRLFSLVRHPHSSHHFGSLSTTENGIRAAVVPIIPKGFQKTPVSTIGVVPPAYSSSRQSIASPNGQWLAVYKFGVGTFLENMKGQEVKVSKKHLTISGSTPTGAVVMQEFGGRHNTVLAYLPHQTAPHPPVHFPSRPASALGSNQLKGNNGGVSHRSGTSGTSGRNGSSVANTVGTPLATRNAQQSIGGNWVTRIQSKSQTSVQVNGKPVPALAKALEVDWSPGNGDVLAAVLPEKGKPVSVYGFQNCTIVTYNIKTQKLHTVVQGVSLNVENGTQDLIEWSTDGSELSVLTKTGLAAFSATGSSAHGWGSFPALHGPHVWLDQYHVLAANYGQRSANSEFATQLSVASWFSVNAESIATGPSIQGHILDIRRAGAGRALVQTSAGLWLVNRAKAVEVLDKNPKSWWFDTRNGSLYIMLAGSPQVYNKSIQGMLTGGGNG